MSIFFPNCPFFSRLYYNIELLIVIIFLLEIYLKTIKENTKKKLGYLNLKLSILNSETREFKKI